MVNPQTYAALKQRVYTMRNGVVADSLRAGGCPYRLVFGLNLPQLTDIAADYGPSRELSDELARHSDLRENALLSILLFPAEGVTESDARTLLDRVRWSEDADLVCFRVLRHAPFAPALASELCAAPERLRRYTGLRLWLSQAAADPARALADARTELGRPDALTSLASMVAQEAEFHLGD